jgi:hypothetical protein
MPKIFLGKKGFRRKGIKKSIRRMESKRGLKKKISRKEGKKPMEEAYRSTARPFWKQKCATHL